MFDVLQLLGGAILSIGYIPQITQLIRTRSCKDLNLKTYLSILAGVALMEAYAVNLAMHGSGIMFLITNSASLLIILILCVLIITIKKGDCMENNIEILFDDLTPEKQAEILATLGVNGNYDVFPIAVIPIGEDDPGYNSEE